MTRKTSFPESIPQNGETLNRELINAVQEAQGSPEAYEKLYRVLAEREAQCWQSIETEEIANWTRLFAQKAQTFADRPVVIETATGRSFTYRELDEASDKIAAFIRAGIEAEAIGLHHPNSFLFLAALIGINKTGRLAILFNTREPAQKLAQTAEQWKVAVTLGQAREGFPAVAIETCLEAPDAPPRYPDVPTTLEDAAFVIFTSGTSGPGKPALFSHRRMIGAGIAWSLRTAMETTDRCYIALPLYHGNGLAVAFSSCVYAGATAVVRERFSVSHFFEEINRFSCTHMVYIGELWRYLVNTDRGGTNPNRALRVIFGNGLNRELWEKVVNRYGIAHVVEHFGATEMPAGALTNWFDVPGFCGFIPPEHEDAGRIVLVDDNDRPLPPDSEGEALLRVPGERYRGYLDPELDLPKIKTGLLEKEDLWWRSGDILRRDAAGFFTFVDRGGDTFRFKGENVACSDVEAAIRTEGPFDEVVVYGIALEGMDGKVGMVSLHAGTPIDDAMLSHLYTGLQTKLAPYAIPHLLRIADTPHTTTATLKIQKCHLAEEGIENYRKSPHYALIQGRYTRIDTPLYQQIVRNPSLLGHARHDT